MSRNYRFHDPKAAYFVSFSVVEGLYVFERDEFKDILVENLNYCQKHKGLEIYAWCIMSNHVHLVFRSLTDQPPGRLLGDFKGFTSKKLVKEMLKTRNLANHAYFLSRFRDCGRRKSNVKMYQFWQQHNHPIQLWSEWVIRQKINYTHLNPVKAGMVNHPQKYLYSSATDYDGQEGLIKNIVLAF